MQKDEMRDILERLGMSQAEFGRRLGVSPTTVSRWVEVPPYGESLLRAYRGALDVLGAYRIRIEE